MVLAGHGHCRRQGVQWHSRATALAVTRAQAIHLHGKHLNSRSTRRERGDTISPPATISPCLSGHFPGNRSAFTLLILIKGRRVGPSPQRHPPHHVTFLWACTGTAPCVTTPADAHPRWRSILTPQPIPGKGAHPRDPRALRLCFAWPCAPTAPPRLEQLMTWVARHSAGERGPPAPSAWHRLAFLWPLGFAALLPAEGR